MDILFGSTKLQKLCTSSKEATREWGDPAAEQIGKRLDDLRAAANLEKLRNARGKHHELKGSRSGQVAVSVGKGLRLTLVPADASQLSRKTVDLTGVSSPLYASSRWRTTVVARTAKNEYTPDVVSPPGATLLDALDERGMTQVDLAERTGRPTKTVNEIIKGKAAITSATALQFEHVLGIPAGFWNSRESIYRDYLARRAEHERLLSAEDWVSMFPVAAMARCGWIRKHSDRAEQARELLAFFQVASPDAWQRHWETSSASFRLARTFSSDDGSLAAWLRQGEIQAESIACAPFDKQALKQALAGVRDLTRKPVGIACRELVDRCASTGVAVVFVRQLPRSRVSGATKWLNSTKALIQLSLRYKRDDRFWFSFFHEAGHICLHGRRDVFIEDEESESDFEDAADRFAAGYLIPRVDYRRFVSGGVFNETSICEFAERIGIAPGVVVGRLQHDELLKYQTRLNRLKRRLEWAANPC